MREFSPNRRENDSVYMLAQAKFLIGKGQEFQNSNFFLYSCLEARLALEKLDLEFILASVNENYRKQIQFEAKRKHGISRAKVSIRPTTAQ